MYLSRLEIQSFRNIQPTRLEFSPHRNYLFGDNAQGKTNLIEAIYLLCLAKSFRTNDDSALVPFSAGGYLIEGDFDSPEKINRHVGIMYDGENGKQIKVDGKRLHQYSKLVGLFPIIILSANDHEITAGPPAQRRRFFNILLSQSSGRYLDDLKQYEKALKQRNKMLADFVSRRNSQEQMDVWDAQLVSLGARIMTARAAIIKELNPYLGDFYARISNKKWTLRVQYRPNVEWTPEDGVEEAFFRRLKNSAAREKQQGKTLVGPHRDEFLFYISDYDLRRFGSRGEHKSALVSLKAAEAHVLQQRTEMPPILLLDDLYAELDEERSHNVLDLFDPQSQVFITGTSLDWAGMKNSNGLSRDQTIFRVQAGSIARVDNGQEA